MGALGPVEVIDSGHQVSVAGVKPRAVLTLLCLRSGELVPAQVLTELLWGEEPPRTATKALQTHVSNLRQVLGDDVVVTDGSGWRLSGVRTDVARYLDEVRVGRAAAASGAAEEAVQHFDSARELWRGTPELPDTARGSAETRRWTEAHAAVTEDRTDALLACGHAAAIIGDLEAAVSEEPLRERRWAQLSLALYRSGRQGEALRAYQRARETLASELGVEPGPELRKLESAIIGHDPALGGPTQRASVRNETRYAKSGELSIAYQVSGDGPIDIVFVPGLVSHVELSWEVPPIRHMLERLGSFGRLIHFDKRGTGLSDRTAGLPTLEERADDIRAVMDAEGVERAVAYAPSEGGQAAIYFAATHPERVSQLVLINSGSGVGLFDAADQDAMLAAADALVAVIEQTWGRGVILRMMCGSEAESLDLELAGRFERNSATPHAAGDVVRRVLTGDATAVLSSISAPTLVISRTGDPLLPAGSGSRLAAAIRGARYVQLPGDFHLEARPDLADDALNEAEEFITGSRAVAPADRVLATVMFTDIVGSTARAAAMTDPKWLRLLDAHDGAVRDEIRRHRGREVKTTGDGFLATFDGPARAVRCAQAVGARAQAIGLEVRAGVHTGEVEMRGNDIAGIAVHIGARVAALAAPSEVLVSSTVRDLTVGSGLAFEDAGRHVLDGVPGEWHVLRVLTAIAPT